MSTINRWKSASEKIVSNDISVLPKFVNQKFLQNIIAAEYKCKNVEVTDFTGSMALAKGDNYLSDVFRIQISYTVDGESKSKTYILKSMEDIPGRGIVVNELNFFEKEVEMLNDVVPAFSKLLDNELFAAKCFYTSDDPIKMLVLEDLKTTGCIMKSRLNLLNFNHCQIVLEKLGKFHATSMEYNRRHPSILDKFNHGMNKYEIPVELAKVMTNGIKSLIKVAEEWDGFDDIIEKIRLFANDNSTFNIRIVEAAKQKPNGLSVLNHGDAWGNNCMFKYSHGLNNIPSDVVFVDFQCSIFSSPGVDLNYFFNTSVPLELFKSSRIDLLNLYYNSLKKTLEHFNYENIPTFEDILQEYHEREFYGFFATVCIFPGVIASIPEGAGGEQRGLEALVDPDSYHSVRGFTFNDENCSSVFKYRLKRFNSLGVFDFK